jgi:ribosomal protein S18 acetylase RimI-like enzyme
VVTSVVAIRRCAEHDLDDFDRFGSPTHVQYCRNEFARGDELEILVAVDDEDRPIGKLHLDFAAHAPERVALLVAAAVAPSLQRRGIGTQLMQATEDAVRERGYGIIELGVEDHNPHARRLYERLGYQIVGSSDFVYPGAPVPNPGVLMRKTIA